MQANALGVLNPRPLRSCRRTTLPGARMLPAAPDCPVPWQCPPDCEDRRMFRVLFFSPRIAPNTGNAIRMVAATGCELHLVEPLGFDLSEPKVPRAGFNFHDLASVTVPPSLPAAWAAILPARVFAFTAHAQMSFADIAYQ